MAHVTTITGTVRDRAGQPIAGARVSFLTGPVALPDIAAMTDEAGTFTLSAPAQGTYRLGCYADGYSPAEVEAEVTAGQAQRLDIKLP
jgi:hypothetical protein